MLHLLSETKALLRTYLARFVDNGVLNSAEDLEIDFENDEDLDVGTAAHRYIFSIIEECDPALLRQFHEDVK